MADRPQRERDMKLPAIETGGRWFTKYNPQIALEIVERIADGELLSRITAKDAVPQTVTRQTFLRWVATVPELQSAYSAALQISAHAFEEKAIEKAEATADKPGSPQNVSAASLLISQYRWSASRRNPTKYSDKGNTQIVVPVNINTTLDMGSSKQTVDVEVPDIYTIKIPSPDAERIEDGEFEEVKGEGSDEAIGSREAASEQFRELLRPDTPVVGTQAQPLIARRGEGKGVPGPRKRVLVPRIKRNGNAT
jgi:hypothetical protein